MVDDFWGSWEWDQWQPDPQGAAGRQYPIVDLPIEHALFRTQFHIWEVPQIANIGFWRRSGGARRSAASTARNRTSG